MKPRTRLFAIFTVMALIIWLVPTAAFPADPATDSASGFAVVKTGQQCNSTPARMDVTADTKVTATMLTKAPGMAVERVTRLLNGNKLKICLNQVAPKNIKVAWIAHNGTGLADTDVVESLIPEVGGLRSDVTELQGEHTTIYERLGELESRLDAVEDDVTAIHGDISYINAAISTIWPSVSDMEYRLGNVSRNGDILEIAGDLTVEGHPVWHGGNDGTGSGLDADTVDGAAVPIGFYRLEESFHVQPGATTFWAVSCEEGDVLTGGGFGDASEQPELIIRQSTSYFDHGAWFVQAYNPTTELEIFPMVAICADMTP